MLPATGRGMNRSVLKHPEMYDTAAESPFSFLCCFWVCVLRTRVLCVVLFELPYL